MSNIITVNKRTNQVMGNNATAAYELYKKGLIIDFIKNYPLKENTWYDVAGSYGTWVLEHNYPANAENGEQIEVKFI